MGSCSGAAKLIQLCLAKKAARCRTEFSSNQCQRLPAAPPTAGLERLPAHLKQRTDIFILELGINDAFRGVPTDQIETNFSKSSTR